MRGRSATLRVLAAAGAAIGYTSLLAFLSLVGLQIYRWFRDGEWTHVGLSDGLRATLEHCCVRDGDNGKLAAIVQWLEAPVDWLGLHKVIEVMPASLALFGVAVAGNALHIYCKDRRGVPPQIVS